ncbi:hypothetical protein RSOLAG1IB_09288 [Rhizoctonia solani AG-1 IB]|uniref:Uncharacterized protein n=1 Tax=Thanatephorus cucumeris (strain AG1-IB / isolate 7/3/14) TaxID=1108050 RepID=A0A0B7FPZ2_THACB|nr:hypothetical protein RSOLAG1IB_09288 [Rhizoctonia solani AG-1 IB]
MGNMSVVETCRVIAYMSVTVLVGTLFLSIWEDMRALLTVYMRKLLDRGKGVYYIVATCEIYMSCTVDYL